MDKMIVGEPDRDDLTAMILRAKKRVGMSPVWLHSAATGMNAFPEDDSRALADLLGLPDGAVEILAESPLKIWDQSDPTDPYIYRLHEIVGVCGTTIRALINEEFGNGIMSAIDFSMHLERGPHPRGDRVRLTMSGKCFAYSSW
ncbi:cyanase [Paracoccus fontiphilus]|uniref:Cyanate hydratase n=1 Tax=Paracoccus fontiphilus TaxID=1815556 RepID=A0ABV7ILU0_9RHOB|nr:cyanate hydratase [Paracoccus fontiphilus]